MRKLVERTLKELYGVTDKIREPEITPVLEGNCRIQGPVDESDHELRRTNLGTFSAEEKFEFINKSFHMKVESGTCNVCSAPCSSCMHNNQTLLAMESKVVYGSSRNSCATKEADSSFICADGMPLYKSRICDDLQRAASNVSNLFSASSSHDSYSENAESKATVRTSASEDINMPPFLPLREVENQFLHEKSLFSSDSHITSDSCHRMSSQKDEEQRGLGSHGDNISCITGVKYSNTKLGHHNMDLDYKNATCSSASADILLSREVENIIQGEAIDCFHASGNEKRGGNYKRQVTCPEESFQKKCEDYANTAFSDKPDLAEVHLPNCRSSPKVQSPCFPSHNGNAIRHNGDCKVSVGSVSFQPHIDGESSSGPQIAVDSNLEENKPPSNIGDSKASDTGTDAVKITDPCSENENGSDKGISSDVVMKSGTINMELKIPSFFVEASDMQKPQLQNQQVMEGGNSESEPELTDVKVCDICGDAGREELLAFCSRCSDGAEHTYCMRVMLRKVPEGDWLCEECQLKEDAERKKVDSPEKLSGTVKQCKLKEDDEVKKVDRSEKVPGIEKECKLKEDDEVKKVDRYEKVSGIAKDCKRVHAEVKKGEMSEAVSRAANECKQEEDIENKEDDKSETKPGTSKQTCLSETSQKLASKSNSKLMPKLDVKMIDPEVRRVPKGLQSPRISAKRHAEMQDVMSPNSKKPTEISGECIETASPRKNPALSRDSSFKNLDTGKTRVNMPPSNGSQSANNSRGFSRSKSMLGSHVSRVPAQPQPPHGFLSRSSSLNNSNSKPKVKQLTQNVLVKPKITRESSLNDTRKAAVVRSMTKSASFKSLGFGRSNTESASKPQFIHQPHVEEPRCLKQVKERNKTEKKISSTLDCPLTSLSPRSGTGTPLPKMDMKIAIHDVKLNNMSESNILRINKGADNANGLGRNDAKKRSIYSAKPVSASLNAKGCSEDQSPRQTLKEGARGCSSSTEKLSNNAETVQHRGVFQTADSTHRDDKTKDPTIFSSSKQAISGGSRILRCQRCNETGHATQFCSIDKLRSSALKPSSDKNPTDGYKKGNKWKAAVETAILKSRLQKNNRQSDQSEEFPSSSANLSCEVASKDFLLSSSNLPRNIPLVVGTDGQEEILRSSDVDSIKTSHITDVGQLSSVEDSSTSRAAQTIEVSCTPKPSELNATDSVSDELNKKHLLQMLPDQASELSNPCRTSAIPELEFIWQGSLEVLTTGSEPAPFDGIQAHLSTSASPKILEVASKLPCKLRLEEVSWISSWPLQCQGINPDEHNIALFFFAKDVESYERSYSKLLEKMLKNDLALRGHNNGVELLIFPSTKLPVHSQRWNRLFFLWGIFKGRRTDNLTPKPSSHKQPSDGRILNIDLETQDLPCALSSVVFDSQRPLSAENPVTRSPRSDILPKPEALISSTWVEMRATSSPKVEDRMCRVQDSPVVHSSSFQSAAYSRLPSQQSSQSLPEGHFLSSTNQLSNHSALHPEPRFQMTNTPPCSEVKSDDAYLKNLDFGGTHVVTTSAHIPEIIKLIGLHRASPSLSTSSDCRKDQRTGRESSMMGPGEEEISMKNEAVFYDDPQGDLTWIDCLSWEMSNRKRALSCSTEAVSKASYETTKSTGETMLWKDEVNYLPVCLATDGERERKKNCFDEVNASNNFREETSSAWKSSKVHPLFGSFLSEQHSESRDGNSEVVVPDDTRSQAERFFFPVQPSPVQNTQSDKLIHILSSDDEDDSESNSPDLELALGGKQRARKKRRRKDHAEDDISASLSLSLAIPTPKAEWQKPILKSEQHLPDRPDVNTALLLFGGFTDT